MSNDEEIAAVTAEEVSSEEESTEAMTTQVEAKVDEEMSEEDEAVVQQRMEDSFDPFSPQDTSVYGTKDFAVEESEEHSDEVEEAQHSSQHSEESDDNSVDTVVAEGEKFAEWHAEEPVMIREDKVDNMPDLEQGFGQQLLSKIFGGRH